MNFRPLYDYIWEKREELKSIVDFKELKTSIAKVNYKYRRPTCSEEILLATPLQVFFNDFRLKTLESETESSASCIFDWTDRSRTVAIKDLSKSLPQIDQKTTRCRASRSESRALWLTQRTAHCHDS